MNLVKNWKIILIIVLGLIFIVGLIFSVLLFSDNINSWVGLDNPYKFSGILSGVFAGLAFLGVLFSLALQVADYDRKTTTDDLQRFENTLFNMLSMHQEVIKSITCIKYEIIEKEIYDPNKGNTLKNVKNKTHIRGKEAFQYLFQEQTIYAPNENLSWKGLTGALKLKGLKEGYKGMSCFPLQTYFKHLYRIVKFIDDPKKTFLTDRQRYEYVADNVRSTLESYELYWIYYHCLIGKGNEKFKPLVEKYSLLKNINTRGLVRSKDCEEYRNKNSPRLQDITLNLRRFPFNDYELCLSVVNDGNKDTFYIGAFYNDLELKDAICNHNLRKAGKAEFEILKT